MTPRAGTVKEAAMTSSQVRTIPLLLTGGSILATILLARTAVPFFRDQARGVAMARAAQQQMADLRQQNERAACASRLVALGQLLNAYTRKPAEKRLLPDSLQALAEGDQSMLRCPAGSQTYIYLGKARDVGKVGRRFVTVYEPLAAHEEGAHFLFVDGHVEWMDKSKAEGVIRQLQAGQNPP